MHDRHEVFQVTCPAHTPSTAPVEVATEFDPGEVQAVEIHWPRGHASLTGIAIAMAHQPIIPRTAGQFILSTRPDRIFTLRNMPGTGQWSVFLYNTDNRDHYWQVVFEIDDTTQGQVKLPPHPRPLPVGTIRETAGLTARGVT